METIVRFEKGNAMGRYIDMVMLDCANAGIKIAEALLKARNEILAWSYKTEKRIDDKYDVIYVKKEES